MDLNLNLSLISSLVPGPHTDPGPSSTIAESILYLSLNPLALPHPSINVGTTLGFHIYTLASTPKVRVHQNFGKGIGLVEQLRHTNMIALVGGGVDPWYNPQYINFWDDHQSQVIGRLHFKQIVRRVQFTNSTICVILESEVQTFNLTTLAAERALTTYSNPYYLGLLTTDNLVILASKPGQIQIQHLPTKMSRTLAICENPLRQLVISPDGLKLAICSTSGTKIRVVDVNTGQILYQLHRGLESVNIQCLVLTDTQVWLTSNKKTLHRFTLLTKIHQTLALSKAQSIVIPCAEHSFLIWIDNNDSWRPGHLGSYQLDFNGQKVITRQLWSFP